MAILFLANEYACQEDILLDMSKAFDNIRHDLLLSAHRSIGYLTVEVPASVLACPIKSQVVWLMSATPSNCGHSARVHPWTSFIHVVFKQLLVRP